MAFDFSKGTPIETTPKKSGGFDFNSGRLLENTKSDIKVGDTTVVGGPAAKIARFVGKEVTGTNGGNTEELPYGTRTLGSIFQSIFGSKGALGLGKSVTAPAVVGNQAKTIEEENLGLLGSYDAANKLIETARTEVDPTRKNQLLKRAGDIIKGTSAQTQESKQALAELPSNEELMKRTGGQAINTALAGVTGVKGGLGQGSLVSRLLPEGVAKWGSSIVPKVFGGAGVVPIAAESAAAGTGFYVADKLSQGEKITPGGVAEAAATSAVLPVALLGLGKGGSALVNKVSRYAQSRGFFGGVTPELVAEEKKALETAWRDSFSARESTLKSETLSKQWGKDPAKELSELGIIPDLEYKNGRTIIRTKNQGGGVEQLTDEITRLSETLQESADKVGQIPGKSSSLEDLKKQAIALATKNSEGSELKQQIAKIESMFEGYKLKYGDNIDAGAMNRVSTETNRLTKAFNSATFDRDAAVTVGQVMRTNLDSLLDDTFLREANRVRGRLLDARGMLEMMDGKNIGGGRFTNIIASAAGSILGNLVAADAGATTRILTSVASAVGIKEMLKIIQRQAFGGSTRERILTAIEQNSELLDNIAKKEGEAVYKAWQKFLNENIQRVKTPALPAPSFIEGQPWKGGASGVQKGVIQEMTERYKNPSLPLGKGAVPKTAESTIQPISKTKTSENVLIEEAKKYKTPEEFVKAQEKNNPLYEAAKDFETANDFKSFFRGSATQYGKYRPEIRKFGTTEESVRVPELGINPEKKITIYRGLDESIGKIKGRINDGDFVTTDYDSAAAYSGGNVVSKEVRAKDLILDYPEKSDYENPFYKGAEFIYSDSKNKLVKYSDADLERIFNEAKSYKLKTPISEWERQKAYIQKYGEIPDGADIKGFSKSPEYRKYGTDSKSQKSAYYEYVSNKIDEAIKTKSQLTDIWNQANKTSTKKSVEKGIIKRIKPKS